MNRIKVLARMFKYNKVDNMQAHLFLIWNIILFHKYLYIIMVIQKSSMNYIELDTNKSLQKIKVFYTNFSFFAIC